MPRPHRRIEDGTIYHVTNRGNGRRALFGKDQDFIAFGTLLGEAFARFPVDLLAYCLMGNHWHLLLRPRTGKALSRLMAWLTVTHARRHHQHYPNPGSGHLYQGRFKSFPVQSDEHFLIVARYIHANPVRAGLVRRAQDWRWSDVTGRRPIDVAQPAWPVERPRNWLQRVNEPLSEAEVDRLQISLARGTPFGTAAWTKRKAKELHLESTLRPRGRPKRPPASLSPRYRRARERAEADKSA